MTLPRRHRSSLSSSSKSIPTAASSAVSTLPDIPSPVVWRYSSRSPDLTHLHRPPSSQQQQHPISPLPMPPTSSSLSASSSSTSLVFPGFSFMSFSLSKSYMSPLRIALCIAVLAYFFIPSRLLRQISSHPGIASVSEAGRRVFGTFQPPASNNTHATTHNNDNNYPPNSLIPTTASSSPTYSPGECQISNQNQGVAIVAACMNRHDTLKKSLPTWLAVKGVHQVVVVDWGSDPPLKSIVRPGRDARIKLIRVDDEKSWVLSRAYNLGMNASSCGYILRTDCDYSIAADVLSQHNVNTTESSFYTGNWRAARDTNEAHLNGAMVVKRDKFFSVGGYDERIQTYGWDDEDLYTRLESKNLSRKNISYDHISHLEHDDASRKQTGVKFAQVQIDVNRIILDKLEPWTKAMQSGIESSTYKTLADEHTTSSTSSTDAADGGGRYVEVSAAHIPRALQLRVPREEVNQAWLLALGRRLADDHRIPWDVMSDMTAPVRERLLRQLMRLQDELDAAAANGTTTMTIRRGKEVAIPTRAKVIIVHCQHGLGNRLRALASALAFAKNAKRVPIVLWERDAHIAAGLDDLFEVGYPSDKDKDKALNLEDAEAQETKDGNEMRNLILISTFNPKWPFVRPGDVQSMWAQFQLYNYMEMEEGAKKGETIVNDVDKHLYYKGAYIMEAWDYTWWEAANEQLRNLVPVKSVRLHLTRLEQAGIRNAIGVHIRNKTLDHDIENVDMFREYGRKGVEEMEAWRRRSSVKTFTKEMQRIIDEEDSTAKFYIASDTFYVLDVMEQRFGTQRIMSTKRECDDRHAECIVFAVVDLYALSMTRRLLGSNWSSYTETAQRLGGVKASLSGINFGPGAVGQTSPIATSNRSSRSNNKTATSARTTTRTTGNAARSGGGGGGAAQGLGKQ